MTRKRQYDKKPFESTGASSDTSANIYMSMLMSAAWKALTANQQRLYLYCKAQLYAEKRKPKDDPLCFTMNRSKWADLYGLYARSSEAHFRRDMSALIEHGFITCAESGANTRTKNIYRYSDMWRMFGSEAFVVLPSDMTAAMLNKARKEKE